MNSRKRLAPPQGSQEDSRAGQFWGSVHSPTVPRAGEGSGWARRGKKGKKGIGNSERHKPPKRLICAEAKPSQCPNHPKINVWYLWKGPPSAGNHLPTGGTPQVKAKPPEPGPPAAATPLFLCFPSFCLFSLFLAVQGVELRCPGSVTMPEGGKFQQLQRKIPCGLGLVCFWLLFFFFYLL